MKAHKQTILNALRKATIERSSSDRVEVTTPIPPLSLYTGASAARSGPDLSQPSVNPKGRNGMQCIQLDTQHPTHAVHHPNPVPQSQALARHVTIVSMFLRQQLTLSA